jgi:hypothetical protein
VLAVLGADASALQSSAELVAAGEVWRLLTSGLVVDGVAAPQIALTAAAAWALIRLEGPLSWWAAVLVGHVGSALLAYAIVGVAIALGSAGRTPRPTTQTSASPACSAPPSAACSRPACDAAIGC